MSYVKVTPGGRLLVDDVMRVCTSKDMIHWNESVPVVKDGKEWGNHYVAIANSDDKNQTYILKQNEFCILTNHNGTNVMNYPVKLIKK